MNDKLGSIARNSQYLLVEITEVNPESFWVEGVDASRSPYRIEWYTHGPIVQTPKVGEKWIITRVSNIWKLMWKYEDSSPRMHLASLRPGDKRIEATRLHLLGEVLLNGSPFENIRHIYGEVPSGTIDGINKVFSVKQKYIATTMRVYLNGLRTLGFVEDNNNRKFTMNSAPSNPDTLIVDYDISPSLYLEDHGSVI